MTTQRIIYLTDAGLLAIVAPADCGLSLDAIAAVSVPAGRPYRIVDATDLPANRVERDRWTIDPAELTDGVGGVTTEG